MATNNPQQSTANEGTATETFKFGGLKKHTTNYEIESFFRQFSQDIAIGFECDCFGKKASILHCNNVFTQCQNMAFKYFNSYRGRVKVHQTQGKIVSCKLSLERLFERYPRRSRMLLHLKLDYGTSVINLLKALIFKGC